MGVNVIPIDGTAALICQRQGDPHPTPMVGTAWTYVFYDNSNNMSGFGLHVWLPGGGWPGGPFFQFVLQPVTGSGTYQDFTWFWFMDLITYPGGSYEYPDNPPYPTLTLDVLSPGEGSTVWVSQLLAPNLQWNPLSDGPEEAPMTVEMSTITVRYGRPGARP